MSLSVTVPGSLTKVPWTQSGVQVFWARQAASVRDANRRSPYRQAGGKEVPRPRTR